MRKRKDCVHTLKSWPFLYFGCTDVNWNFITQGDYSKWSTRESTCKSSEISFSCMSGITPSMRKVRNLITIKKEEKRLEEGEEETGEKKVAQRKGNRAEISIEVPAVHRMHLNSCSWIRVKWQEREQGFISWYFSFLLKWITDLLMFKILMMVFLCWDTPYTQGLWEHSWQTRTTIHPTEPNANSSLTDHWHEPNKILRTHLWILLNSTHTLRETTAHPH